jgi:NIPSNAP
MLVDVRTYRVKPGKLPQELDLYAKHGLASQIRHLGAPLAYLHAESGDLNTMVHLWAFEDAGDRARTRTGYLKLADEAGYLWTSATA